LSARGWANFPKNAFFELAKHFRTATNPKEVERLGDKLGQMGFGR